MIYLCVGGIYGDIFVCWGYLYICVLGVSTGDIFVCGGDLLEDTGGIFVCWGIYW